jgi:hypothetical protein
MWTRRPRSAKGQVCLNYRRDHVVVQHAGAIDFDAEASSDAAVVGSVRRDMR